MKYLITGRNGQLASSFITRFETLSMDFVAPDEKDCDITDSRAVAAVVSASQPDIIINCAAYNLVDKAEQNPSRALSVNETGPRNLAAAAKRQGAVLVHYSSDYVFDGDKQNGLYVEADLPCPVNQYGRSKLAGENAVKQELDQSLIFRLSWVFGPGKQNFIHKFLERARDHEVLQATCDEFSVPTYTETVVDVTLQALEQGVTGLFHLTNSGFCSRYEWAKAILAEKKLQRFIRPVLMESFHLPARRPGFSAMSNRSIAALLKRDIPAWDHAVSDFLKKGGF